MRKKLGRAPKIAGVPLTKESMESLSRATMDILTRQKASLTERERRYGICLQCPDRKHDRCSLCGCFIKTKTILLNSECPAGRWLALSSESTVNDTSETETSEE